MNSTYQGLTVLMPVLDESMKSTKVQYFTKNEVNEHQKRGDLWLIIHGKVYDVSPFLEDVIAE